MDEQAQISLEESDDDDSDDEDNDPTLGGFSVLLDLARLGTMSLVLTAADLHAVKGNAGQRTVSARRH